MFIQFYFENQQNWQKVKEELLSWLGTPYKHMTCVKGRGVDCNLFIGGCLKNLGILKDLNYDYYPTDWFLHNKEEIILEYVKKHRQLLNENFDFIEINFPQENLIYGDYLGFSILNPNNTVNHSGILLDNNTFIHASINRGVIIEEFTDYWKRHLKKVFRLIQYVIE